MPFVVPRKPLCVGQVGVVHDQNPIEAVEVFAHELTGRLLGDVDAVASHFLLRTSVGMLACVVGAGAG